MRCEYHIQTRNKDSATWETHGVRRTKCKARNLVEKIGAPKSRTRILLIATRILTVEDI